MKMIKIHITFLLEVSSAETRDIKSTAWSYIKVVDYSLCTIVTKTILH